MRLCVQNPHKLLAGDGLFFVQILGNLVQLAAVVGQQLVGLLVLLLHDLHHLGVHAAGGLLAAGQAGVAVGVMDDLYKMGDVALNMVKTAIGAYVQVDLSTAAQVIARDDDCDTMFSKISREIAQYIAAHPDDAETALDLFMIAKYLERLGDHAVNVAEWVEFLKTGVHKSRKIV